MRLLLAALMMIACFPFLASADDQTAKPFAVRVVGTGKPIIFIPGLACSGEVWNETVEHLSKKYQCHVLTLAGFAGQPPVEGSFLERNKKAIAEYIRAEKLDKPAIIGHSIGGYMTFLLGVAEPDLVGPLVSIDGVPCLPALINPGVTADQMKANGEQLTKLMASQPREEYLKHQDRTLSMWLPDAEKRKLPLAWGAASDQKLVATAMGELMSSDLRQEVSKIKSRTLLVAAPAPFGNFTREELQKRYSSQVDSISNGRIVFAEKSRHFIMYDEPEWMREQIEKFLAPPGEQSADAKAIVEKAIKAHGGADKLAKQMNHTWKTKGSADMGGAAMPFTAEYAYAAPLHFRYDVDINIGEDKPYRITGATVGDSGWSKSGDVVDDLEKVKREAMNQNVYTMYLSLLTPLIDKQYSLTPLGESKHENQTLIGIKVAREGYKDVSMFFDKDTGLFVKNSTIIFDAEHAKKDVQQDTVFGDYSDKDGAKVFGKVTIYHDGKKFIVEECSDHQVGVKIDSAKFEKPKD